MSDEKEDESELEIWTHRLHESHLLQDAAIHLLEHFRAATRAAIEAEIKLTILILRENEQMIQALRVSKAGLIVAKNLVAKSGRAPRILIEATAEFERAKKVYNANQPLIREMNLYLRNLKNLTNLKDASVTLRLAQASQRFKTLMGATPFTANLMKTGRFLTSETFSHCLIVVGGAMEACASYKDSTAVTTPGKTLNAVLGGGSGATIMVNPWIALTDMLLPKQYKLSSIYHGGSAALASIGETAWKRDSPAMVEFQKRSISGEYGSVIRVSSDAGQFWADKGICGGLTEFWGALGWSKSASKLTNLFDPVLGHSNGIDNKDLLKRVFDDPNNTNIR